MSDILNSAVLDPQLDAVPVLPRTKSEDLTQRMYMVDERLVKQDGPPEPPVEPWPPEFRTFPKIPRLNREVIITEKIDGTNAVVVVPQDPALPLAVGSRNRWIAPGKGTDNYDFARFVADNEAAVRRLGPGWHHGEWWGVGIARKYNISERRWSLFNTSLWTDEELRARGLPPNVTVVPVLHKGELLENGPQSLLPWHTAGLTSVLSRLRDGGSIAAPGFHSPEGIILFHQASQRYYKWTFGGDGIDARKTPSPVE